MTILPFPRVPTRPLLGTLPVRPFQPEEFFGIVQVDGQTARVAALACFEGRLLMTSLVGYDTTVSAVLAQLWQNKMVPFTPKRGVIWEGPLSLVRRKETYQQFSGRLNSTKEVNIIALLNQGHVGEGLRNPPLMQHPKPEEKRGFERRGQASSVEVENVPLTPDAGPRFILGNGDEDEPHQRSFLANLYAMRVIFLHSDQDEPARIDVWARELWGRGLARGLIEPVHALGVKAWGIVGTTMAWNQLIGQGVREGWLPWQDTVVQRLANAA